MLKVAEKVRERFVLLLGSRQKWWAPALGGGCPALPAPSGLREVVVRLKFCPDMDGWSCVVSSKSLEVHLLSPRKSVGIGLMVLR